MLDREKIVDELFALAVDLDPGERLALFAAHRVKNGSLSSEGVLDEVEALLADYHRAEAQGFLQQPLIAPEEDDLPPALRIGQQLNGYKVLELIGQGGMGEVYLALDTELERKVAIKVIKSHLNSKELLRRFRNERQILANLQHPNIAQLLEAGTTTDQLPFFVMEYVDGQPIDKYADDHKLSITERLKLFRTVCSAVSYAHQNLIVHRDIKPSNILVTGNGEPKLLDFGIAKLLQAADSLTPNLAVTMFQVMTPEYASPEQVRGEAITTATDVYALGVLLYELLTGRYPHNLKRRSPREVARAVCEQEPERPSTAINRIEEFSEQTGPITAQRVSETREGEPERLRRRLRGDIDNIILKSIHKESQRRYTSVGEFSEDIRRHLEGLPVVARKDTLKYRTSKFIRRNRIGVAAAAGILLMLVAGIVATAWEARVARAQEVKTQRRFNEVRKLAHSVLFDYHDAIANLSGSTPVRERLVKDALEYLDSLAQDSADDVSLQRELATAYIRVGDVQGRPYRSNLGQTEGALASYQKARVILERLSAGDPSSLEVKRDLAIAYERIGNIKSRTGDQVEAFEKNKAALAIRETVLASDPSNANYRRDLADSYLYFGDALSNRCGPPGDLECPRQALASQLKALEIREALVKESPLDLQLKRDLAGNYMRVGFRFTAMAVEPGRKEYLRQSLESHQKGVAIAAELAATTDNALDRRNLGDHLMLLADSQVENGYLKESLLGYERALTIFRPLSEADPSNAEARLDLKFALTKLAHALVKLGNLTAAQQDYAEVLRTGPQSEGRDSTNAEEFAVMVVAYTALGDLAEKEGDLSGAIEDYGKVIGLEERFEALQIYRSHLSEIATYYSRLGSLYRKSANARSISVVQRVERWREAKDSYQKSLDSWQVLRNKEPLSADSLHRSEEASREIAELDHLLGA